jgi:hypothetical protein
LGRPGATEMSAHKTSPRADLAAALGWMTFGLVVVLASSRMDRLEQFGATIYTAPGLVPGILGAAIVLLGVVLLVRSVRRGALATLRSPWLPGAEGRAAAARAGGVIVVSLIFLLGLFGHVPFWLATATFIFVFMLIFDLPERRAQGQLVRGLVIAAISAAVTTGVVFFVFERIFLVRLP